MDKKEKKALRDKIRQHIDLDNTRLSDYDANILNDFIDNYDKEYSGKTVTKTNEYDGWSSDGKYTRTELNRYTFNEQIGIRHDYEYHDDDGQSGNYSEIIETGRGILNWLKNNK
ncbi:MAG: hypothetical protein Q4B60_05420 [Erysipelotrichaceae bacterium]|nr:hypothetical protein [Erysipelotrichaceae bacterium]